MMNREFVNGENFEILHTLSSYEERSVWIDITDKYFRRWYGLVDTIEVNLNHCAPREIWKKKAKLFFKII